MEGRITKIISNDYFVTTLDNTYICKSRGNFRYKNITPKVGDYVLIENNVIYEVKERINDLERPCVSNVSQAFIVTSLKDPNFSLNLLDKLLTLCLLNKVKPIIIITKSDLVNKKDYKKYLNYYKKLGFKVLYNYNLYRIKHLLKNKTTVFTGQSGSGKSTLLNKLDKNLNFETNEISKALGRGKHTTRQTTLIKLHKGFVVDTPGFSDISLKEYSKEQIRDSFIEFKKYNCMYKNCMHVNEKECLVKKEVNKKILKERYENYIKFLNS